MLLAILFCLGNSSSLLGHEGDLRFREPVNVRGDKIGPSNALFQDEKGFVYIGTNAGLYLYNGYRHLIYKNDSDDPDSLSSNEVSSIFEDGEGTLWIGTGRGLDRFDRFSGTFHTVFERDDLNNYHVRAIAEGEPGVLWLGTQRGLIRYEKASGDYSLIGSGLDFNISTLHVDALGLLWGGTAKRGLFLYDSVEDQFDWHVYDENDPQSIGGDSVNAIVEDDNGTLWVGTQASRGREGIDSGAGGLCSYNRDTDSFKRFPVSRDSEDGLRENAITAMMKDYSGRLWIGMQSGDLYQFDPESGEFSYYPEVDPKATHVSSLLLDHSGALWVGRQYSTVLISTIRNLGFRHWGNDGSEADGLSPGHVVTIFEDSQRVLWVGTLDHGLNRYDSETDTFVNFLPGFFISALHEDRQGNLWVASLEKGLTRFDRETNTVEKTYTYDNGAATGLPFERLRAIWEDAEGILWAGHESGLAFFDRAADVWRSFDYEEKTEGDHVVKCSYVDSEGRQWIGTNGGVLVLDPKNGELQ